MHRMFAAVLLWILTWSSVAGANEPWPTVINLRDIGGKVTHEGLCVRRNVVYRSGNFDHTRADDALALVQRLHLADYYDLRAGAKESDDPHGPVVLREAGVQYHNLPIDGHDDPLLRMAQPDPGQWAAFYGRTLQQHGATLIKLMDALAQGESPAVYGCTLGKDRTGIATALLLSALGVEDEAIIADYAASSAGLAGHLDAMRSSYERLHLSREDFAHYWMTAHPATMQQFLDHIRQDYGGVVPALRTLGMSPALLNAWRARMLAVSLADCL